MIIGSIVELDTGWGGNQRGQVVDISGTVITVEYGPWDDHFKVDLTVDGKLLNFIKP